MKPHSNFSRVLSLLFAGMISSTNVADDWPLVRGDERGTGVARSALPDSLDVIWTDKAPQDAGFDATAVVADGIIYIGDSAGMFHALRLADGGVIWTKQFENSSFGAGAAVDGEYLYVGDLEGAMRCLAVADGSERWNVDVDAPVYAGPTPQGDDVLVTSESGILVALNKTDGKQRWRFSIDAPLRCSPTISAGRVLLAGCDSLLHVVNVADGKETHTVEIDGPTGSTPAMHGERVYFGTEGGTFYCIDVPVEREQRPAVAWTYRDPQRGQSIRSAAAVSEQVVVYGSQGKAIYALDSVSGELKWKLPTRSRVESSPVIAGQRVVAATTSGKVYVLDFETGEVTWEFDAGGSFVASPAIADGQFVLGNTDGTLYCFGARSKGEKELTTKDTQSTETGRDSR